MRNPKSALIAALSFLMVSTSGIAQSSPFSYNYVQAGYAFGTIKVSGVSLNTTGFGVGGSSLIGESVFLLGGASTGQAKLGAESINQNSFDLGIGGRLPIDSKTDAVSSISYLRTTQEFRGTSATVTGYGVDFGLKHLVAEKVEIGVGAGFSVIGAENVRTTSFSTGLRFKVSKEASIGISYSASNNSGASGNSTLISARLEF